MIGIFYTDLLNEGNMKKLIFGFAVLLSGSLVLSGCAKSTQSNQHTLPQVGDYIVLAWNDLGMHCLNPTYDLAVILPPYNTIWAQVIKRGNPPQIVTTGFTAEYNILSNTYSYGKRSYGQFWDNDSLLFGVNLVHDTGLNLVDPAIHNSLSGEMVIKANHFEVDGIPITPVNDAGVWNPFQVAEITIKNGTGDILATTRTTVPTSDEINCIRCHGANAFLDILQKHDSMHQTNLENQAPVLCASCHGSPALGNTAPGVKYLSQAIHGSHASRSAVCYDCHPGVQTACNRSLAHTATDGNCTTCHGEMSQVAGSVASSQRTPWINEPKCSDAGCHTGISGVDTGTDLYRKSNGHGGLVCASCHGSPHAMVPSRESADNYQALQYQNKAVTIGSCAACHSGSKGEGSGEFAEQHGGSNPEQTTACNICHTAVSSNTSNWPHAYQWKNR
jgi:hypothetical protein